MKWCAVAIAALASEAGGVADDSKSFVLVASVGCIREIRRIYLLCAGVICWSHRQYSVYLLHTTKIALRNEDLWPILV